MRSKVETQICTNSRWSTVPMFSWTFVTAAASVALAFNFISADAQTAPPIKNATGFVYTADEVGNAISTINLATGNVAIVPATLSPHNVQISADGAKLVAVGDAPMATGAQGHGASGSGMKVPGQLLVFSTASMASGPTASIILGDHPAHVVVERSTSHFAMKIELP